MSHSRFGPQPSSQRPLKLRDVRGLADLGVLDIDVNGDRHMAGICVAPLLYGPEAVRQEHACRVEVHIGDVEDLQKIAN